MGLAPSSVIIMAQTSSWTDGSATSAANCWRRWAMYGLFVTIAASTYKSHERQQRPDIPQPQRQYKSPQSAKAAVSQTHPTSGTGPRTDTVADIRREDCALPHSGSRVALASRKVTRPL